MPRIGKVKLFNVYTLFVEHYFLKILRGRRGHDRMVVDLQLPLQSVHITTNVVSSNPTQAIQHYVMKFVSDLRQVSCFLLVLWFPPPIKLTATI